MFLNLDRAQRSKLHIAMLEALDAPDNSTEAAFAEVVAWADTGGIDDLATVLDLSAQIDAYVYSVIRASGCKYADVNADSLREIRSVATVNLALKLAGIRPHPAGRKMRWTNAPGNEPTVKVTLNPDNFTRGQ